MGYFSRIKKIFNVSEFSKSTTIDLGCGQGAFYNWLCDNRICTKAYIGIDFAIKPCKKNDFCTFICDDIRNIHKYLRNEPYIVVLCNVLCYLEDNTIREVFDALNMSTRIIIIEPAPNIFWDAHFNGIKPIYRTYNEVCLLLKEYNCTVENSIRDYFFKVSKFYFAEMSYGITAVKN